MAKHKLQYAMSRRRKHSIIAAVLLVFISLAYLDNKFGQKLREETLLRVPRGEAAQKYHLKTFKVVNIVDGDTLDIDIPDGKYNTTRIRLLGVDTPETKKPGDPVMYFGPEAANFAKELNLGKDVTVIIDTVSDTRDRYGRLLAYIRLPDGKIFNEEIIRQGYGYADLRFKHGDYDKYVILMEEAINNKTGLWKEIKREQLPKWLQRERPLLLK